VRSRLLEWSGTNYAKRNRESKQARLFGLDFGSFPSRIKPIRAAAPIIHRQGTTTRAEHRPDNGNASPRLTSTLEHEEPTSRCSSPSSTINTRGAFPASPTPRLVVSSFSVFKVSDIVNLLMIAIASAELGKYRTSQAPNNKFVSLTAERHAENVVKGEEVNQIPLLRLETFDCYSLSDECR
jgi:hypothetical protein